MRAWMSLSALLLSACGAIPEHGSVDVVSIDAPRFCHRAVRAYSDFAFIRPSHETVVGNDCIDREPMKEAPVLWAADPSLYDAPPVKDVIDILTRHE